MARSVKYIITQFWLSINFLRRAHPSGFAPASADLFVCGNLRLNQITGSEPANKT